jgi:hypothetical protein
MEEAQWTGETIDKAQWRRRLATELECPVAMVVKSDLSRTDVRKAIAISGKGSWSGVLRDTAVLV